MKPRGSFEEAIFQVPAHGVETWSIATFGDLAVTGRGKYGIYGQDNTPEVCTWDGRTTLPIIDSVSGFRTTASYQFPTRCVSGVVSNPKFTDTHDLPSLTIKL